MNKKRKYRKKCFEAKNRKKVMRIRYRSSKKKNRRVIFRKARDVKDEDISISVFNILNKKKKFHYSNIPYKNFLNQELYINIPENFSISENPRESIKILSKLFTIGKKETIKHIKFDYSKCKKLGLAASTVMDSILLSLLTARHDNFVISGTMKIHKQVRDILYASGLFRHFKGIKLPFYEENDKITPFQLIRRKQNSEVSDVTTTKIVEYLDKCLATQKMGLTSKGKNKFSNMIGEVIDNCQIHGGRNSVWHVIGHYQLQNDFEKNNDYGELQLVFFDFGNTIYEEMLSNDSSKETKEKFKTLCEQHKKYFDDTWDEENLSVVFSLQARVSRLRDSQSKINSDRGTGTIRLIETFSEMGKKTDGEKPVMTLTSGHTHIEFLEKYCLKKQKAREDIFGKGEVKIIAFNDENDILRPPTNDAVQKISEYFPGTIISMKFFLQREYIMNQIEK